MSVETRAGRNKLSVGVKSSKDQGVRTENVGGVVTGSDEKRYAEILQVATDRSHGLTRAYAVARIEAYFLQAKLGKRPLSQSMRKISVFLDRVEDKKPELFEDLTRINPATKSSTMSELRAQTLPPLVFKELQAREKK